MCARRPAPSGGPVVKSLMICCSYKGCVSRFGLADFWELFKHNHDSGGFAESSHPSWSRRAVILLFATFHPARLLKDRSGQNLLQFHGSFFKRGQTEPLHGNISYWLLRVEFQMHNGCSLQMLNGEMEMRSGSAEQVWLRGMLRYLLGIGLKKKERLVFF